MVLINLNGMVLKDRYCIVEQIGKGGSGNVYLARDMELGVFWAVKELPVSAKKEARLLASLEHHLLPKMADYTEKGQYCYIIMERINGEALGESLRNGKVFSIKEAVDCAISLTQVLGYLHTRKPPVFYGDLKPDNLMISESGKLYLVDLGSAVTGYRDRQGVCMGTQGFAAPEQYQGRVGKVSDVYGLGKTLEALLGKKKRWLFLFCPRLAFLIFRCCRKKETERYQDMKILEKKLQKIQKNILEKKGKGILAVIACALIFAVAAVLLLNGEKKPDFYEKLTEVTDLYYGEQFLNGNVKERKQICKKAEEMLQKLLHQHSDREEQKVILSELAFNSEYAGDEEHAAFYYEQMILYDGSFREAYGEYGMFLLRIGQEAASGKLWNTYMRKEKKEELDEGFCRNLQLWEEYMNERKNDRD